MTFKTTFYLIKNKRFDIPYSYNYNENDKIKDEECSICLEKHNNNSVKLNNCGHIYHEDCIIKCIKLNPLCPLCRQDVYEFDCKCIIL